VLLDVPALMSTMAFREMGLNDPNRLQRTSVRRKD
jgi:hypothetical protein